MFLKRLKIQKNWGKSSLFIFLPFFLLYLFISIANIPSDLIHDEPRYVRYANNLLNGFLSPSDPASLDLWSGPGYSLLISLFLSLKLPLLVVRLFNSFLLYATLIISFKTLRQYTTKKNALLFIIPLGLYFPIFKMVPLLLTECLTWFLVSVITYFFITGFKLKTATWKQMLVTALVIAYLALTKVIFGYVILCMLIVSVFLLILPRFRSIGKKSTLIFLFSLIFCFPYLVYTYNLTNQIFYWSNSGSMSLYTMSSPFEDELGDWKNKDYLLNSPKHASFSDSIYRLNPLERDAAFKSKAIENIENHPKKYFKNWTANVGRMIFSYPFSNEIQTMKLSIVPNIFVVVLIFFGGIFSLINYKRMPAELIILSLFILVYLFGSSLVSTYLRMFYITIPFWIVFISYVFTNVVSIKVRKNLNE